MTRWTQRLGRGVAIGLLAVAASGCLPAPLVVIDRYVGTGEPGSGGDGGPLSDVELDTPIALAVGPDGAVYVGGVGRIRRIGTDGVVTTVAGGATPGSSGDGGPAIEALVNYPRTMAFDGDGNLYLAEAFGRVRRIDTAGTITTVAGGGFEDEGDDGGPAVESILHGTFGLAVADDGSFYVSEREGNTVRHVDVDGTITTVAGSGVRGFAGDGGPAVAAQLNSPSGLGLDAAGNLYVADTENNRVRKVDDAGTITTVAGNGEEGGAGDGGSPLAAQVGLPSFLLVDPAGNLLVSQTSHDVIRFVSPGLGVVRRYAGITDDHWEPAVDGIDPLESRVHEPAQLAVDAAGDTLVAQPRLHRVRVIRTGAAVGGIVQVPGGSRVGVPVELYAADDRSTPIATTTTDANGEWSFRVPVGTYVVRFVSEGNRIGEWWADSPDAAGATPIVLARGSRVRADATLAAG